MAVHPLRPATRRRLGRPLPHQQADRPRAHPLPKKSFHHTTYSMVLSSIRPSFPGLSQSKGQITHVLLTRSPLEYPASRAFPFDLHVLSTPPAFVLSQDQTLHDRLFVWLDYFLAFFLKLLRDCFQSAHRLLFVILFSFQRTNRP